VFVFVENCERPEDFEEKTNKIDSSFGSFFLVFVLLGQNLLNILKFPGCLSFYTRFFSRKVCGTSNKPKRV